MNWPDDFINKVICGDCLEVMKEMDAESVDMCMTSPPYWGLRDYGHDDQYGLEKTPEEYIEKMTTVFHEVKRVLKKEGVLFLNIGDTYSGSGKGSGDDGPDPKFKGGGRERTLKADRNNELPSKCLCMIPERLAWSLIQDGWILRNKIIWYKPNGMPSSVKDRFSNKYEFVYMFCKAKERKVGYQDISEINKAWLAALIDGEGTIGIANKDTEYQPYLYVGNTNKALIDKVIEITGLDNNTTSKKCNNKTMWMFRTSSIKAINIIKQIYPYLIAKKEQAKVAIKLQESSIRGGAGHGQPKRIEERRKLYELIKALNQCLVENAGLPHPDLSLPQRYYGCEKYYFDLDAVREPFHYPERTYNPDTSNHVTYQLKQNGNRTTGGLHDGRTQYGNPELGKNPGDVFEIPTQPFPGAHFAVFPEKLCEKPIKAGCPEGGTVLDPFCGAGTTCYVAKEMGRKYIGIDIKAEYVQLTDKRLAQGVL